MSDLADLREQMLALPEENARGSRDFGRGYSKAVRDVLDLIDAIERRAS